MVSSNENRRAMSPDTRIEISDGVEWITSSVPINYPTAIEFMEDRVDQIYKNSCKETIWLLEHLPVYTAGTGANDSDLLNPKRFPIYYPGRGGQYTYHGPGQRVAYVMLDLSKRSYDIRLFVENLECWLIEALSQFGILGERRKNRIGIWVKDQTTKEKKIAAIGIRVRRWITFHGVSINVNPTLSHFDGIVPCGIKGYGVTSLHHLGSNIDLLEFDLALKNAFTKYF